MRSLNEGVHANVRRMACRGNGTSFPLPRHDLLKQLKNGEQQSVPLPRVGAELADTVSILLKTAGGDTDEKSGARLIHQAHVRRHVVVNLIEEINIPQGSRVGGVVEGSSGWKLAKDDHKGPLAPWTK